MITWIVWICIAGLVFGVAGWLGVFILPLLFIGWKYFQRQGVEQSLRREEQAMDMIIAKAIDDGDSDKSLRTLYELRKEIRTNLPLYLAKVQMIKAVALSQDEEPEED